MPEQLQTIEEKISSVKRSSNFRQETDSSAGDQPQTFTTEPTAPREEETPTRTLSPSAESTTENSTEFTGEEPLEYILTLKQCCRKEWVVRRLSYYQEAVVRYAEAAKREKEAGRTVSEAEWQATIETEGITRAVSQEQAVYNWILEEDDA